jgi:hypothetical protein
MNPPYKTVDFILENAPKYAKAKAERIYLEEFRKTKKALLMKVAMEAGYESAAAQEREAYAHPDYQVLLKGVAVAVEQEELLRWKLTAATLKTEIWRTESANERNGIKATE